MKINFIKCPCGCELRIMARSYVGQHDLTDAEAEIADLLVAGLRYAVIARRRGTPPSAIRRRAADAYTKIGVPNRLLLMVRAVAAVPCV
jgi:DNA-binding NarL/FixJ family response regulator